MTYNSEANKYVLSIISFRRIIASELGLLQVAIISVRECLLFDILFYSAHWRLTVLRLFISRLCLLE